MTLSISREAVDQIALLRVADGASVWLRLGWDVGVVTLPVEAVLFDWRGTLVVTLPLSAWVEQAVQRVDRDSSADAVADIETALVAAMEHPDVQKAWDRAD